MEEKHLASGSDATEKLYYHDSHGREFTATVLSCEEKVTAKGKKEGYRVVLDLHLIFPGRRRTVRGSGLDRWTSK